MFDKKLCNICYPSFTTYICICTPVHICIHVAKKGPVIRATFFFNLSRNGLLHCKLKPSVARITTFVTNLSRSKIQCCKSAEFYTFNWSNLCYYRWLLSYNLAFRRTLVSRRHFLLNFSCQRSSLSIKLSFVSNSLAKSCISATVLPNFFFPFLLLVLKGQNNEVT